MPVLLRVGAIDLGHKMANEGFLVERREIGTEEVVTCAEKTVMIDLPRKRFLCSVSFGTFFFLIIKDL